MENSLTALQMIQRRVTIWPAISLPGKNLPPKWKHMSTQKHVHECFMSPWTGTYNCLLSPPSFWTVPDDKVGGLWGALPPPTSKTCPYSGPTFPTFPACPCHIRGLVPHFYMGVLYTQLELVPLFKFQLPWLCSWHPPKLMPIPWTSLCILQSGKWRPMTN